MTVVVAVVRVVAEAISVLVVELFLVAFVTIA